MVKHAFQQLRSLPVPLSATAVAALLIVSTVSSWNLASNIARALEPSCTVGRPDDPITIEYRGPKAKQYCEHGIRAGHGTTYVTHTGQVICEVPDGRDRAIIRDSGANHITSLLMCALLGGHQS